MMEYRRRLKILAFSHGALALVTGAAAFVPAEPFGLTHLPFVPHVALALCQVVLLGTWAAFSTASPGSRLAVSAAALGVLQCLFLVVLEGELATLLTMPLVLVAGSLIGVRRFGYRLERPTVPVDSIPAASWTPRFSIRGLMILTAGVALLGASVKSLSRVTGQSPVGVEVLWSVGVVIVGLLGLRAGLGLAAPAPRTPVVFVLSLVIGGSVGLAAHVQRDGWIYLVLIMLLYPAALVASLVVVRSCGYRLWKPEGTSPPDPVGDVSASAGETANEVLAG